jgi:hypothetical protein
VGEYTSLERAAIESSGENRVLAIRSTGAGRDPAVLIGTGGK